MMPGGMNPKQMQTIMKRMGIKVEEIHANRVIIERDEGNIVISNPQVMLTKMPNQEMFQITGDVSEGGSSGAEETEEPVAPTITDDDVTIVAEQAGVGREQAHEALVEARGDIAQAILKLKGMA